MQRQREFGGGSGPSSDSRFGGGTAKSSAERARERMAKLDADRAKARQVETRAASQTRTRQTLDGGGSGQEMSIFDILSNCTC